MARCVQIYGGRMLQGDLVTLRPVESGDYPTLAAYANDLQIELLGGGDPPVPRSAAAVDEFWRRRADDKDTIDFAIAVDGKLIGQCGLTQLDPAAQTAELGITIGEREYWGRGYGRDAVRQLIEYAFRIRNLRKIWLRVHANNARAIRSYESVGFVEEGRQRAQMWCDGEYVDLVYMGLQKRRKP